MTSVPSMTRRIAIGKSVGLIFGMIGFVCLPILWSEADPWTRWGILFWYITVGAIIGLAGVYTTHPVLQFPMPWWVRAPLIGAWMNFVLTFFAYETMSQMLTAIFGLDGILSSPFWFVVEGALIGCVIIFAATRFAGEGPQTVTS